MPRARWMMHGPPQRRIPVTRDATVRVDEAAEQAQAQAQKRRSRQGWAQQRLKAQLQNGLIFQAIFFNLYLFVLS